MEETSSKRQREETHVEDYCEDPKRHKPSYNHILSLLEDIEDEYYEPNQDLSSILTTLQQELSCDSTTLDPLLCSTLETDPDNPTVGSTTSDYNGPVVLHHEEERDRERVMRHLLEASDDELGLPPPREDDGGVDHEMINGGDCKLALCNNGLWEFEDEAANYYSLLQSQLFM